MTNDIVYYNLSRHWTKKIEPHLNDKKLNDILVRDMNKLTYGRWSKPFTHGRFPEDFETNDWRCEHRGKEPRYWRYVKHAGCHWIVNFSLHLATLALPNRKWRIISSQEHSTVWDGKRTLFDFNFQAMGMSPVECFSLANKRQLPIGKPLRVYWASHYTMEDLKPTAAPARLG